MASANKIINSTHAQSEDTTSSLENKSNFSELRDTNNDLRNNTDKSKENVSKVIHKDAPIKSQGEKKSNRRKSMCFGSSIEAIFSSDDDFEALKNSRKSPLRENSRHFDKYRNRGNCSSKDTFYNNETNRFIDHGKHTHDRYEPSSKYTRHSPEKYHSKFTKEHSKIYKSRADYRNSRQRVLRSPFDKYNRSKSRDRRTFERENYYDKQRYSSHDYDTSAVKHKIRNELEEINSKRQKTDQHKMESKEENICNNDRETEHGLSGSFPKQQDFTETTTCQSPDYINIESAIPQYVVKEIKQSAVIPLEDPRVLSKKYTIKTNKETTVLSTVVSAEVDIKPVKVSEWDIPDIEKFLIPPTLPSKLLPEETVNDFVNEIYMDIDKPTINDSLESGEIQSVKDYDNCHNLSNSKDIDMGKIYENENCNTLNSLSVNDSNNVHSPSGKYRIPKIKKSDKMCSMKSEDYNLLSKKQNFASKYCNDNKERDEEKQCKISTIIKPTANTKSIIVDEKYRNNEMTKINTLFPEKTLAAVGSISNIKKSVKICTSINKEDYDQFEKKKKSDSKYCNDYKRDEEKQGTVSTMIKPIANTQNLTVDEESKNNEITNINTLLPEKPLAAVGSLPKIKKSDKICTSINKEHYDLLPKKVKVFSDTKERDEVKQCEVSTTIKQITSTKNITVDEQYNNNEKIKTLLPEKTLSTVGCTLADDLELSDEAGDGKEIHIDAKKSKKIFSKAKQSMESVEFNKHVLPLFKENCINNEFSAKNSTLNLNKVSKDYSRDTAKTRKIKKKTELKDAYCTDAKEQNKGLLTVTELKKKPVISMETKHKFSDLFGDSNSLITPDDLGIPLSVINIPLTDKYVSIFDNTQDAVDLSVEDINRAQSNASKILTFPNVEDESNKIDIEKVENNAKQLLVSIDENATSNNLPEKATTNNSLEVVKTVIISTGVQPNYISENITLQEPQKGDIDKVTDKANIKTYMLHDLKALATSTPHKTETVNMSEAIPDPAPNDANKIIDNNNLTSNGSYASNLGESPNDTDVPDVRLIVRRRRKIIKKP